MDSSSDYLDIGCGSGLAASFAAKRGAKVSGVDASENLISIAKSRTPEGKFQVEEIENLPFDDNRFSCVTGFNSFQYAANPLSALKEARRVTQANALVIVMTWGEPENMEAAQLVVALKPLLPSPPPGAPGPFALSDESRLKDFAVDAGLSPVEVFDVNCPWIYSDLAQAVDGLTSSGVAAKAIEHSGSEAVKEAHIKALKPFVKDDGRYIIDATFRCLVAST